MKNRGVIDEFTDFTGTGKKMTRDQLIGWYSKVLDIVKLRYRKISRFARCFVFFFRIYLTRSLNSFQGSDSTIQQLG